MAMDSTSNTKIEQGHIFVTLLILLWGLILIFVGSQYTREKQYKVDILNSNLQQLNCHLADVLDIVGSPEELYELNADRFEGLHVELLDKNGEIYYNSHPQFQDIGEDIELAITNGSGYWIDENNPSGESYFFSSTDCDSLIVRTSLPYHITITEVLGGSQTFLFIAIIISIIISYIGYVASKLYAQVKQSTIDLKREHALREHEIQEKNRIKRQLSNNINHELKTPICSILGYLDMIMHNTSNLSQEQILAFAGKSYDQAQRLRQLMSDLSTITRIDEASAMIECEPVDVTRLVADIVDDVCPQAMNNSIAVVNNLPAGVVVEGNSSLLYSIFRNLVDNAIAYSGGRSVWIDLTHEDSSRYIFAVRDNGIGIERKHLDYIFERFYRVDKGRSRKHGGTGLGLSIVKNAVLFHGGSIEARIAHKGGAEFHFSLQKLVIDREA